MLFLISLADKTVSIVPDYTDRNFIRDLSFSCLLVTPERALMTAPFMDGVRSWSGFARLGWLTTMVDVATSDPAMAVCRPDWTATQDLSFHGTGWLREGPALCDCRLLRMGKRTIVVSVDIYDAQSMGDIELLQARIDDSSGDDTLPRVARGLATFVRIPGAAASGEGVEEYNPANWVGQLRKGQIHEPMPGTIDDWVGLNISDAEAGVVELACVPYVANSIGTVNGGVQAVMIEAAAEALQPGMVATDIQMHFLAQLKSGPVRTRGSVCRTAGDHSVVKIDLVDAGAGERVLTTATVTLQIPPQ